MEVPILCHSSSEWIPRYKINAVGKSVCLTDDSSALIVTEAITSSVHHTLDEDDWKARMVGGASMNMFCMQGQKLVLTTHALVEEPNVICIRVLKVETVTSENSSKWMDAQYSSSIQINLDPLLEFLKDHPEYPTEDSSVTAVSFTMMDLDVKHPSLLRSGSTQNMRSIVKTACFRIINDDEPSLEQESSSIVYWNAVFVDNKGSILTIRLRYDHAYFQLRPVMDASIISENRHSSSSIHFISMYPSSILSSVSSTTRRFPRRGSISSAGITLVSSQVDFLDSHRVLLATSSGLLCVHTVLGTVASWSESQCIVGENDTLTTLTYRMLKVALGIKTDTDAGYDPGQNQEYSSTTFTLGRTVSAESIRKKRQSISNIFKSATGLLQGKSVVDMFMEQQHELQQKRKSYRARYQQEAYPDMNINLGSLPANRNTNVYDAFLDVDDGVDVSTMAAVCAVTAVRTSFPLDPSSSSVLHDFNRGPVKAVFTLHADGMIRMWTMPDESVIGYNSRDIIFPWTMKIIYDADFVAHESQHNSILPVPPPHTWSSSFDSVSLTCKLFHVVHEKEHDTESSNVFSSLLKTPKKRYRLDLHEDDLTEHSTLRFSLIVSIRAINVDIGKDYPCRTTKQGDEYGAFGYSSPCNLILFRGNFLPDPSRELFASQIFIDRLQVPDIAQSIGAISFGDSTHDAEDNCRSLHVLYNCLGMVDVSGLGSSTKCISSSAMKPSVLATYNGNSLNSFRVEHVNTLDDLAFSDKEDFVMQSAALRDSGIIDSISDHEGEDDMYDDDIDRAVLFIESFYMRKLFRSCWGRSLGGVSLSEGPIRRAIIQVCPLMRTAHTPPSRSGYLEIDTLTAMREWASYQETKSSMEGATRKRNENDFDAPSSMSPKSLASNTLEATINHGATMPRTRKERRRILARHHTRWIKFMLSVWNEVAKSREALLLLSIPSFEDKYKVLLLRNGVTTCTSISLSMQTKALSEIELLDNLSVSFLQNVSRGDYNTRLKISSQEVLVQYLTSKASLALITGSDTFEKLLHDLAAFGSSINDPILSSNLDNLMGTLSDEEIRIWLFSLPSRFQTGDHEINQLLEESSSPSETNEEISYHLILPCSSILIMNAIEDIRKLSLSRFLTLARGTGRNPQLKHIALRIYLTMTAYQWTFTQLGSENCVYSPVSRRGPKRVLDFALAHFLRRMKISSRSSFDLLQKMCYEYVAVSQAVSSRQTNFNWIVPANLKDRFKFILRLVSPLVAYQSDLTLSQRYKFNETVATCLLSEIGCSPHVYATTAIIERASSLLKRDFRSQKITDIDRNTVIEVIQNGPTVEGQYPAISEDTLTEQLQLFVLSILLDDTAHLDTMNVVAMESFRTLLRPWIVVSSFNQNEPLGLIANALTGFVSDPTSCVRMITTKFLEIACLIHRTEILQSLCSDQVTILSAISDCVAMITKSFPESFYKEFIFEFSKLWSSAYHHALLGRQWPLCLEAIQANPRKDVKILEFKRLVLTMIDAGQVDSFLDFLPFPESSIDFYELALDTLADAAYEKSTTCMTSFLMTHVNHSGCLFALNASQRNWRRCAEAMDYFGLIRLTLMQGNQLAQEDKHFGRKVMDDLTLSAVASLQLSHLITNPTNGGGIAQPIEVLAIEDSNTIATMLPSLWKNDKPLSSQAFKVMAMRILFIDSSPKCTASDLISTPSAQIMAYLAQFGYMSFYTAMAEIKAKICDGSRPGGRDLIADAMTYLIHEFLAPVSLRSSCVVNEDLLMTDIPFRSSRPSASQLFHCSSGQVIISDSWRSYEQMTKLSKAVGAMELIRVYTERYSNPNNVLAIEVANTFLELDNGQANLPYWLETLLLSPPNGRGLFTAKTGNPCALILIYIRWGMLLEAAAVASSTLFGNGIDRKKLAPSRLPEKGDIDFVPYKIIDLLWDLIDKEIADPNTDDDSKENFRRARTQMERALTEHFELMKISEAGLHSARVLNPL